MKSLTTPRLVRKLRSQTQLVQEIVDELAERRVEIGWRIDSRYVGENRHQNVPCIESITRKESL